MSNLQVLPLLVENREPLRPIVTADLKSSLAKTLKDVPALALAMDRESWSALSLTDRSCYHAIARHELWRDMWQPLVREGATGPLPATPAWLSHRDVYLSFRAKIQAGSGLDGYSQPSPAWYKIGPSRPYSDPATVASDNCQRAAGRKTIQEFFLPHYASGGFFEELCNLMRKYAAVIGAANKGVLISLFFFCLVIISLAHFAINDDSL